MRYPTVILCAVALGLAAAAGAEDYSREPILYETAKEDNAVARLRGRLDAGSAKPAWDENLGYLPWLLSELNVSTKSQTLVFSKTSVQRNKIGPETPRAI